MENIHDEKMKNAILAMVKKNRKFNASLFEPGTDLTALMVGKYSINSESDYLELLAKAEQLIIDEQSLTEQERIELNELVDVIVAYEAVTYPI